MLDMWDMEKLPMVYFTRIYPTKYKSIGPKSGWPITRMGSMAWYGYLIPDGLVGGGEGGLIMVLWDVWNCMRREMK